jgi:hypothetical protein
MDFIAKLLAAFADSGDWAIGWRPMNRPAVTPPWIVGAAPNPWQIGDSRKYLAVSASRSSIVNVGSASAIVLV